MRSLIGKLKKMRWDVKDEVEMWIMGFLRVIPGSVGVWIRKVFLTKRFGSCGKNPIILEGFRIDNPRTLFLGENFRSNRGCYINAGGTVRIGNDVLLGPDVKIWSVNHQIGDISVAIREQGYDYSEVAIEDDVWVAANVFVAPGVRIGKRSVVAAGTVLTKSVPPYSVVMGNPGRVVRTLERESGTRRPDEKVESRG